MNKLIFPLATAVALSASNAQAALVSYWNFNGLSIGTADTPGNGDVPSTIAADQGSGTVVLTGWTGLVDDFSGTTENALGVDPSGGSLSLVGDGGNSSFVDFIVDLSGYENPIITFATRGTGTGFNSGLWSYSIDGNSFTSVAGNTSSNSSSWAVRTVDFTSEDSVDGESSVTFRYTLDGASSGSGNNRIDNFQINAVPEPSVALLGAIGLLGFLRRRR